MVAAAQQVRERHILGLDLGQSMDFSALVALRQREVPDWSRSTYRATVYRRTYVVRGIRRWPLKTPYTAIAEDVARLVSEPPLAGCTLGIDRTGCGQPVVEMVRSHRPNARIVPVFITAGHRANPDPQGGWLVPKVELCAAVSVLLQSDRLEIPAVLPEAAVLGRELQAFRAKVTASGHESLEADWRSRQHDDLVLGLAISAWIGERCSRKLWIL
jgi:hypothetical protein